MRKEIRFEIPIIPKGQMRARHAAMRGKGGKVFSRTYKAKEQEHEEQVLMTFLREHVPVKPFEGPLVLRFIACLPIPKSKPKWWQEAAVYGDIHPTTVPDLDNLAKHLKDCMTTMRFWEDDRQIAFLECRKKYAEIPRWIVRLSEYQEPQTAKEWEERRAASA